MGQKDQDVEWKSGYAPEIYHDEETLRDVHETLGGVETATYGEKSSYGGYLDSPYSQTSAVLTVNPQAP